MAACLSKILDNMADKNLKHRPGLGQLEGRNIRPITVPGYSQVGKIILSPATKFVANRPFPNDLLQLIKEFAKDHDFDYIPEVDSRRNLTIGVVLLKKDQEERTHNNVTDDDFNIAVEELLKNASNDYFLLSTLYLKEKRWMKRN